MADPVAEFESYRPLMFAVAYRMLGSAMEAEDVVQETYLRYQGVPPATVGSPRALLTTIVTRLCLNRLSAARAQRETYVGPWLPEPVPGAADAVPGPGDRLLLHESLSMAFLVLLEQLTPLERAVFLLREVFEYEYAEIAAIVGKEEAACRQLFSRARKHIAAGRPRFPPDRQAHRRLLDQFIRAATGGDMAGLIGLLAADVTLVSDGGGKVRGAATRPLHGREPVARFVIAASRLPPEAYVAEIAEVNGEPALVLRAPTGIFAVLFVESDGSRVTQIFALANPDKLRRLGEPGEPPMPPGLTGARRG